MVLRGPPGYGFRKSIYEQASGWVGVWVGSLAPYGFVGSGWVQLNGPWGLSSSLPVWGEWVRIWCVVLGHGMNDF
ncbi:hypothetical protein FA13DRAFT_815115 [Coprinellus micaceus]|uniref:Uncharacterized protein n=1 Tax=Coprinellus micaceus TaxID=71717 RepID=A0A4Y7T1X5_COPMI|nr:hypothetical protein FA13DRAFT_815115 [Coprinellus micaceus]